MVLFNTRVEHRGSRRSHRSLSEIGSSNFMSTLFEQDISRNIEMEILIAVVCWSCSKEMINVI